MRQVPIGVLAQVTLGKMVQPRQRDDDERRAPYLRAAHIQPHGRLDLRVEPHEMWFSEREVEQLDIRQGDVLVVEGGAVGRSAYMRTDLAGFGFQNALLRLRPRGESDGRFIDYCLQSAVDRGSVQVECSAVSIAHFTAEKVERFRVPFADGPTQRAIADYLDRETGEIDAMLGKLDALSGVLETRRGEVVKGTLATIERKPYLGLLVNVVSGSGFPHEFQGVTDAELPFFKVSSFAEARQGVMGSSENTVSRDTAARLGATVIPEDSILMAKIGAALLLGRYARTDKPCCIDNNMQALAPRQNTFEARFLAYAMSEVPLNLLVKPGPVPSLDVMGMKMTRVPQPPLPEQRRIADHLDEVTGRIDAMLAKVAHLKALLLERRAVLITDVVTGRKEVAS